MPREVVGLMADPEEVVGRVVEAADASGAGTSAVMTAEFTREDRVVVLAAGMGMAKLASVADSPDRDDAAVLEVAACGTTLAV